jgi:hypothetical protein
MSNNRFSPTIFVKIAPSITAGSKLPVDIAQVNEYPPTSNNQI